MKEITIQRSREDVNRLVDYKVVTADGGTVPISIGETKKVLIKTVPSKLYVRLNWVKSREITVDETTTELTLKGEKIKGLIAPRLAAIIILLTLVPKMIWGESQITKVASFVALSFILLWSFYAFVIKRDDWILVEKN